jgi:O-antigen/teichoic acid export membrane protein
MKTTGLRERLESMARAMRPVGSRGVFRIARNASWLTASRVLGDALSFLVFIAIARSYGPEGTGSYSFGFAIAGFIATITNPALNEYGVLEYARAKAAARTTLFQTILGIQALLVLLSVLALAGAIAFIRPSAEAASLILFLSIYMSALALARTLFIPAYADETMAWAAILELLCRLAATATALVLMASRSVSLLIALIGFPIFGVVAALGAAGSAARRAGTLRADIDHNALSAMTKQIWPFAAIEVIGQLYLRVEVILLGLLAGALATGIYGTGLKFVEVGVSPLILLAFAVFPSLSRLSVGDHDQLERAAAMFLRITLALGGSCALLLCFLVPPLLVPVLGDRFAEAAVILPWMSSLAMLVAIEHAMNRLLLVCDLQVRRVNLLAFATLIRLAVALTLIPLFQLTGAVAAAIVGFGSLGLLFAFALRGHLPVGEYARIIAGFVTVLGAAVGIGSVAVMISPWLAPLAALASFGLGIFVCGLLPRWPIAAPLVPAQPLD